VPTRPGGRVSFSRLAAWASLVAVLGCALCPSLGETGVAAHPPANRTHGDAGRGGATFRGVASWYGPRHQGQRTASGERFDMHRLTAAHRTLRLGGLVRVTNLDNGRAVVVRITDRGPYVPGRVIDVSYGAARALGIVGAGLARVQVDVLSREG